MHIDIRNVSHEYGTNRGSLEVLSDLSLTINKGEISPTADRPAIALNPQKSAAKIKKTCGLLKFILDICFSLNF